MHLKSLLTLVCTILGLSAYGQVDTIYLRNSSFEDFPRHSNGVREWVDCGFPGESPPDVQPFVANVTWGQLLPAYDGNTYLGMVVRDNDTYERVSQRISRPMRSGDCYSFNIALSSSNHYISSSHKTGQFENYVKPAVLRIWGSNTFCGRDELLAESTTIDHVDWRMYTFEFRPSGNYSYIMLEAFYKTPTLIVYNGNILLDQASPIIQKACPGEDPLIAHKDSEDESPASEVVREPRNTQRVVPTPPDPKEEEVAVAKIQAPRAPKQKILKNLSRETIQPGQVIRIESLMFEADTATLDSASFPVLEEIAYFLHNNKDVIVEIGGHTNGKPPHSYCDRLSTLRAKSVAKYITSFGVHEEQVKYKGYGKRQPIASNKSDWGRKRNQRVEIRILSFEG